MGEVSSFDTALENLAARRSEVGAVLSRMEAAENTSLITSENLKAARSQIQDADISAEVVELTRAQILQSAQMSVLAQSNLSMQIVLGLLRP